MKPIEFEQQNAMIAEHQEEYQTLPAHITVGGKVISCWELSPEEIKIVQETGRIWFRQWTFNDKMQPILLQVEHPWDDEQPTEES